MPRIIWGGGAVVFPCSARAEFRLRPRTPKCRSWSRRRSGSRDIAVAVVHAEENEQPKRQLSALTLQLKFRL